MDFPLLDILLLPLIILLTAFLPDTFNFLRAVGSFVFFPSLFFALLSLLYLASFFLVSTSLKGVDVRISECSVFLLFLFLDRGIAFGICATSITPMVVDVLFLIEQAQSFRSSTNVIMKSRISDVMPSIEVLAALCEVIGCL